MTLLTITGKSERFILAERATITARVSIGSRNRQESIRKAQELHNSLAEQAQGLRASGAATWHQASPSTTWVRTWVDKENKVQTEHVTTSHVQVKLSALALVPEVVGRWSTLGAAVSTEWSLTEATKASQVRQLRGAAVAEARAKAADFAGALNQQVVSVVALRDVQDASVFASSARAGGSTGGAAEVTIAEITVGCTVSMDFEAN